MSVKVLAVDDSAAVRRIVGSYARDLASDVVFIEAADGQAGLAMARQERPDIILLDLVMPIVDGEECIKQLKGDPRTEAIPVVMLTTTSAKATVLKMLQTGISRYIVKPFTREEFLEQVRSLLPPEVLAESQEDMEEILEGGYLLIVDGDAGAISMVQGSSKGTRRPVVTDDPEKALRFFQAKEPKAVFANLELSDLDVFGLFSRMRRIPDRQGVRYIGMCSQTAHELISRARASGYLDLLLKPSAGEEVKEISCTPPAPAVETKTREDVFVISAGDGSFRNDGEEILVALRRAADTGHAKVLFDFIGVPREEQLKTHVWSSISKRADELGLRAVFVCRLTEIRTRLGAISETGTLEIVAAADEGLATLAA